MTFDGTPTQLEHYLHDSSSQTIYQKKIEIPKECPYLRYCGAQISEGYWKCKCLSKDWPLCQYLRDNKERMSFNMHPRHWKWLANQT